MKTLRDFVVIVASGGPAGLLWRIRDIGVYSIDGVNNITLFIL
jgi:hypothetical protein